MKNQALIAVAGSGKTETIVQRYKGQAEGTLFVTFTQNGQDELKQRLLKENPGEEYEVVGWFKFLADHFLKPFLYDVFPARVYNGMRLNNQTVKFKGGEEYYFNQSGEIMSDRMALLSRKVCDANGREPISRLERIFRTIVFDEVQDLAGNDLEILQMLLESRLEVFMVGDIRQTVFETTTSDRKNPQYGKLNKLKWFEEKQSRGLLELEFDLTNRRCNEDIVRLSNALFPPELGFEDAVSGQDETNEGHVGIFRIEESQIPDYCRSIFPRGLRYSVTTGKKWNDKLSFNNFGDCKGLSFDHVLIFPTADMKKFLADGTFLKSHATISKFYVAVTRARHSVCFVLPKKWECGDMAPVPIRRWPSDSTSGAI
ncbi:UvrD-helicase domain-containing protein [Corynebacterium cystitidis]|uniref:UvrD-helicase domain-containing protein n=1 Tax=Corynebacterium cystitidis TaxID=35757 RepID=UPI00211E8881|nr:UvrD-helicase domain-containing protein [Corynebacterium cystitidis]